MSNPTSVQVDTEIYTVSNAHLSLPNNHSVVVSGVVIEQEIEGETQIVVIATQNHDLANELKDHIVAGISTYCGDIRSTSHNSIRSDA